ncbi:MAG: M48 family metalloprotease [Planctomycetota bacterium]|nr:M48 family metalloprotease [Planctomycetota bacterium]
MKPITRLTAVSLALLLGACSGTTPRNPVATDWSSGSYVTAVDAGTRSDRAAKVLDRAPRQTETTMLVRTMRLPVHAAPDIDSRVLATLDRGDAVTVVEWSRFYDMPGRTPGTGPAGGRGIPSWARVTNQRIRGFVAARSLVSPSDFAPSNSLAPDPRTMVEGSPGAPRTEGADYAAFETLLAAADHPATRYRQSRAVLEGTDPSLVEQDRIDLFGSVTLEEHDPGRDLLARRVVNVVQPLDFSGQTPERAVQDPEGFSQEVVRRAMEAYLESDGPDPDLDLVIGRELGAEMLALGPVLEEGDPRVIMVNAVGMQLAEHSSMPYPIAGFLFVVIDNDEVEEALSTPIGIIYITTGLLKTIRTDSELALVLAHEIAHVEHGHGIDSARQEHHRRLSAFRRIMVLEELGELDGHIQWVLADLDAPDEARNRVASRLRETLLEESRAQYGAGVRAAARELRHGMDLDLEIVADARAMSLSAAAGYDPNRFEELVERFDDRPIPYGGAKYPRARRIAAREILEQLPPPTGVDRNTLITCLENDLAREEILRRAESTLDEGRASLLSDRVQFAELGSVKADVETPRSVATPLDQAILASMGTGGGTDAPVPVAGDEAADPMEATATEEPVEILATPAPGPTTEEPGSGPVTTVASNGSREPGTTAEANPDREVVYDPDHFTRRVARHEFNRLASPEERSIFANFIERHPGGDPVFLRYSIRGHGEVVAKGPFGQGSMALVTPDESSVRVWRVRGNSKAGVPERYGAAHRLGPEDEALGLVNESGDPVSGWLVLCGPGSFNGS